MPDLCRCHKRRTMNAPANTPETLITARGIGKILGGALILSDITLDVRRGEPFAQGHLPGARNFSVYGINTYDTDPAPMASFIKTWAFQLALAGITREDTVVVCGQTSDEPAARAAWFLDWLDHPEVALLDGGASDIRYWTFGRARSDADRP